MSTNNSSYTQGYSEAVLRSHASRTAETSAAFLLPHLKSDAKILDVGCGPGTITTSLAGYVPEGSIVGTDYSEDVVAQAQKRLERLRDESNSEAQRLAADRCRFEVASVFELPFADESFDVVYCHQMLLHLPKPVDALKEMRRVCKRGGIVAAREADFTTSVLFPSTETFDLWLSTAAAIYRSIGSEPDAGRRLVRWALDAGYEAGPEHITFSSSNQAFGGQPHAEFWGKMWAERIAAESWQQQALSTGKVVQDQIQRMQQDWLTWSAAPDGTFVMVCGEVLLRK
ncbi:SAM-dependent methyltransferases [Moesziomyces antarcticus T-34]|uniref:SAM-dependent methyltransferases n=1 Tax=Pseudozyma antarctica (strain T-34) TaxID=1151754 RepID=M9MJ38_PSEA3|nr:SAM-dependent methyltransferases [Moesziomyces antarcticus T-34]